ncbi:uncharacterized protein LOC125495569 [Beta vulgaris subsp. vulgaris]|uniref:uncharacterized protein LOC125495569 n=1 Tax=Beta vulgaris subsp. vulgaris TaxID=3555 RepID=UPI0020369AB9|nr:uncharacterized protein LOC125495569 [Beta vulgaris subsp. vulgaris]
MVFPLKPVSSEVMFSSRKNNYNWPPYPDLTALFHQPFSKIINHLFSSIPAKDFNLFAIGWWFIWFSRNQVVFRESGSSTSSAAAAISKFASNWLQVSTPPSVSARYPKRCRQGDSISWSLPLRGSSSLILMVSKLKDGKASCGFVVRDDSGEAVVAGAKALGSSISILQAEAWGLREGVKAALEIGVAKVLIEGDNLAVINSVNKSWRIPWEIANIISDVARDIELFSSAKVHHVFKEANRAADFMASKGQLCSSLVLSVPPF